MQKPAVFLDRDGVLNHLIPGEPGEPGEPAGSPRCVEQLALFRQAPSFVRSLNELGYLVLVVTDQPGMARGDLGPITLSRIHRRLERELAATGARLDGIHFCPHDPEADPAVAPEYAIACRCRRPAPGLILRAAQLHHVDLSRSFMVCRDLKDVKAGRSAAIETILLTSSRMQDIEASPDMRPHHVAPDLAGAIQIIQSVRSATEAP